MNDVLEHRGPDDSGFYRDYDLPLGHRRLSIIDLAGGHQPMVTPDGPQVIVFNGEIYNYQEVRDELVSHGETVDTTSDTEVLLRLYQREGASALERIKHMLAFAVYDRARGEIVLARDRVGIELLCCIDLPGRLLIASEVKALPYYAHWSRDMIPQAVRDYVHDELSQASATPGGRRTPRGNASKGIHPCQACLRCDDARSLAPDLRRQWGRCPAIWIGRAATRAIPGGASAGRLLMSLVDPGTRQTDRAYECGRCNVCSLPSTFA
jgi:asparagine synthetase B (glutamine-hydrolysing)